MLVKKQFLLSILLAAVINCCYSQITELTYAEKLGYPKGAKVLIIHVDDAGMSYDSNQGTIDAITNGAANSCSVMMPCPWVPAFVHYLKQHPGIDAGLHLTLTSEWDGYRWGSVTGKTVTQGLTDKEGNLWPSVEEVVAHASADEVEKEIRAQLEKARTMGFEPTHLDSHMGTLFATPEFLKRYVTVGIENQIPVMLPGGHDVLIQQQMNASPEMISGLRMLGNVLWTGGLPVLDDLHNYSYEWPIADSIANDDKKLQAFKTAKYIEAIHLLKPGVTMMIMHCTNPSAIFKEITDSGPTRKGDMLAMNDPAFKKALKDAGIILTTWKELKERRLKVK